MTTATAQTRFEQELNAVNGKRRERTLTAEEIREHAADIKSGEHVFLHGGHVSNSYKYQAWATGAVLFKLPRGRKVYALMEMVNAKKGSTGFGRHDQWKPEFVDRKLSSKYVEVL